MTETEFREKLKNWIEAPKEEWNLITFWAYFYHKYEEKYGVKYLVKGKNVLSTKETKDLSEVLKIFQGPNWNGLSREERDSLKKEINLKMFNYINWMFDFKLKGKSVTSTGIFLLTPMLNEFNIMWQKHKSKSLSSDGFSKLIEYIKKDVPGYLENYELTSKEDLLMIYKIWEKKGFPDNDTARVCNKAKDLNII